MSRIGKKPVPIPSNVTGTVAGQEVKVKGPQSSRNYAWWGQVGQTVFSLGGVGAAVMGQVYAGIPCVIGGALSNVALKYLAPAK